MADTGLYLELKMAAHDDDPKDAVRQSVDVANRIGIPVHVQINGVMVWAYPGDNAELLVVEWEKSFMTEGLTHRGAVLTKPSA